MKLRTSIMILLLFVGILALIAAGRITSPAKPPRRADSAPPAAASEQGISVYFSPDGGCIQAIAVNIGQARRSIDVQAFILSTSLVGQPLMDAVRRGVKVRVIFDKRMAEKKFSIDEQLAKAGVEVYYDELPDGGNNHNKTMIIDDEVIITGSFNFSRTADEDNVENLLVLRNKPLLAAAYLRNFEQRIKLATPRSKRRQK